jgi:hypothetical protein
MLVIVFNIDVCMHRLNEDARKYSVAAENASLHLNYQIL